MGGAESQLGALPPPANAHYKIVIKSGKVTNFKPGMAITIALYDEDSIQRANATVPMWWDMEKFCSGDEQILYMEDTLGDMSIRIHRMEIKRGHWSRNSNAAVSWFCEWVKVKHIKFAHNDAVFNAHCYIQADVPTMLVHRHSCLSQDDPYPEQRADELEKMRQSVSFIYMAEGIMPTNQGKPFYATFHDYGRVCSTRTKRAALKTRCKLEDINGLPCGRLNEIKKLYVPKHMPEPRTSSSWENDDHFAQLRLSGINPFVIKCCRKLPAEFGVNSDMVNGFLDSGLSLASAMADDRIYIVDFSILRDIPCRKSLPVKVAPMGLFFASKSGQLKPLAIQLVPNTDTTTNPVFRPSDPKYTWLAAKMWFNTADSQHHLAISKIARTNFLTETFAVAILRNLSPKHPLYQLVAPHIRYIIEANKESINYLMDATRGWLDRDCTLGRFGTIEAIRRDFQNFSVMNAMLPHDLEVRGVDNPDKLRNYHYREDGLLIYGAIRNYVCTIIEIAYPNGEALRCDFEVQGLAFELSDDEFQKPPLRDMPMKQCFNSVEQIAQLFTFIIYTATGGFGATHNSMYETYGAPLYYSSRLRGKPPASRASMRESDIVDIVPERPHLVKTMLMAKVMSERVGKPLGEFDVDHQVSRQALAALSEFREDLDQIEKHILQVNKKRRFPYTNLLPSNLPNCPYG